MSFSKNWLFHSPLKEHFLISLFINMNRFQLNLFINVCISNRAGQYTEFANETLLVMSMYFDVVFFHKALLLRFSSLDALWARIHPRPGVFSTHKPDHAPRRSLCMHTWPQRPLTYKNSYTWREAYSWRRPRSLSQQCSIFNTKLSDLSQIHTAETNHISLCNIFS